MSGYFFRIVTSGNNSFPLSDPSFRHFTSGGPLRPCMKPLTAGVRSHHLCRGREGRGPGPGRDPYNLKF